jgi:predicted 3-demethylubiquinone-9 3-methyltransferase (glyoxalase superfamily)
MAFVKTLIVAALAIIVVGAVPAVHQLQVCPADVPGEGPPPPPQQPPQQQQQTSPQKAGAKIAARELEQNGAKTNGEAAAAAPPAASLRVTTLLMFYGKAEEAMTLYTSVIPNSKITSIKRYGKGEAGVEGTVMLATFTLGGQEIKCIDSPPHDFTFTPATLLFVTCQDEAQIDKLFAKLSKDGKVYMPLQAYPFARKFAWFSDRFGVSWQLNCPKD